MNAKRTHTLPAAAVLVHTVLATFGKEQLVTCEHALRDGLVADWFIRHRPEVNLSRTVADPRRRSVMAVMNRYGVNAGHARHVARTALILFDATASSHRMRIDDRRLLEFAALLHDVGHHIAGEDHHHHGQYLIRHTRMSGFTAPELAIIAALVRYHRGKPPKPSHDALAGLNARAVQKVRVLSGILRLADSLDRSHNQVITEVLVELTPAALVVTAHCRGPGHLERWAAVRRSVLLAEVLERPVTVEVVPLPAT
jgi:exopolyphosphatase/guanosine-5'-triphosphate,3'-diphosphate pyrophosphatase